MMRIAFIITLGDTIQQLRLELSFFTYMDSHSEWRCLHLLSFTPGFEFFRMLTWHNFCCFLDGISKNHPHHIKDCQFGHFHFDNFFPSVWLAASTSQFFGEFGHILCTLIVPIVPTSSGRLSISIFKFLSIWPFSVLNFFLSIWLSCGGHESFFRFLCEFGYILFTSFSLFFRVCAAANRILVFGRLRRPISLL